MTINSFVARITAKSINALYGETIPDSSVTINETRKEFKGDLTVVTFPFTRSSKKSPEETGGEMGTYLQEHYEEIAGFSVVKGFLNMVISDRSCLGRIKAMTASTDVGSQHPNGTKVMVEYSRSEEHTSELQ